MSFDSQRNKRVVLDTCVCVDLISERNQTSSRAVIEALQNHTVFKSRTTMRELRRTLDLPSVVRNLNEEIRDLFFMLMEKQSLMDINQRDLGRVSCLDAHDGDKSFLALPVKANADFLVTRDTGLLALGDFQTVQIVSPGSFLDVTAQVDCPEYRCGRAAADADTCEF